MIFTAPIPFDEALKSRAVRALLPNRLTSEEISRIRPSILEASTFSAQVDNARHVQRISDVIEKALKPDNGMNLADMMEALRNEAKSLGYDPEGKSIKNLASDQRVRLIAEFNTQRARAVGQHAQLQDETILDLWPAQEFYRAEDRKEIRNWPEVWAANGGQFFEGPSDYPQGRMVALVNDPIWTAISEFGTPVAPFAFGSGMDVKPVDRQEAEEMGLIQPNERVNPEDAEYPDPETTSEFSPELEAQVLEDLGPDYQFVTEGAERVLQRI